MIVGIVILNVVFVVLVLGAIIALHGWAIATDPGRGPARARVRHAPRRAKARWNAQKSGVAGSPA